MLLETMQQTALAQLNLISTAYQTFLHKASTGGTYISKKKNFLVFDPQDK